VAKLTVAVVNGGGQRENEAPEEAAGLQLLGQEVAEEQRDRVQEGWQPAPAQRVHRQCCRADHLGHLESRTCISYRTVVKPT